jgi:prophage regulatory protein
MSEHIPGEILGSGERVPARPIRLIRLPAVMARVGIKRSMIYRLMGEGRFPRSRSLGPKCAVWVEAEIEDWILKIAEKRQS